MSFASKLGSSLKGGIKAVGHAHVAVSFAMESATSDWLWSSCPPVTPQVGKTVAEGVGSAYSAVVDAKGDSGSRCCRGRRRRPLHARTTAPATTPLRPRAVGLGRGPMALWSRCRARRQGGGEGREGAALRAAEPAPTWPPARRRCILTLKEAAAYNEQLKHVEKNVKDMLAAVEVRGLPRLRCRGQKGEGSGCCPGPRACSSSLLYAITSIELVLWC